MKKDEVMATLDCSVSDGLNISSGITNNAMSNNLLVDNTVYTCWDYWHRDYYPSVIRESYPIYIRERAEDKGKQAFEIIKILQDKRFLNLEKVKDFIDLMDCLIKVL